MAKEVLDFWFHEIDPKMHFAKDLEFDQKIRDRFGRVHTSVAAGEAADWRTTPEGRLAEIIVLDQLTRNMFRGSVKAFAFDSLALKLAQEAVTIGADRKLALAQRAFFYLPYMHSEDPQAHEKAVELFSQPGLESNLRFEILHKKIIERFGRFPHRNEILGRASSIDELEFLKEKGSSF